MKKPQYPLRKRFNAFNHQYFGGEIPAVKLAYHEFLGAMGRCSCKGLRPEGRQQPGKRLRRHQPGSIKICLSSSHGLTDSEFDEILLHEMIHAWLFSQDKFLSAHGQLFRKKREALEEVWGRPIGICESEPKPTPPKIPDELVALCWFDGEELRACAFALSSYVLRAKRRFRDEWRWVSQGRGVLRAYRLTEPQAVELADGHKVHRPTGLVTKQGKPTINFASPDKSLANIGQLGEPMFTIGD
jgi:hypothetical protein